MSLLEYLIMLTVNNGELSAEEKADLIEQLCKNYGQISL